MTNFQTKMTWWRAELKWWQGRLRGHQRLGNVEEAYRCQVAINLCLERLKTLLGRN